MYVSTKYDTIYTEVAHLVSLDGCAQEFGSVEEGGWYALVNIGGAEEIRGLDLEMSQSLGLAAAYVDACEVDKYSSDMDLFVIIRENDQGFVYCEMHTDLETEASVRFEEMQAEYDEEWGDDED